MALGGSRSSTAAQPSLTTRNWRLSIGSENTYTIHPYALLRSHRTRKTENEPKPSLCLGTEARSDRRSLQKCQDQRHAMVFAKLVLLIATILH
ncbi:hypothetical protein JG687_00011021 [Phytophthora cactorum]|uniref:Uncharacterized protein n=1 Tax=Phytophthora cactorum TaxID=29920 RepID=A0A8T1U7Z5_9STRA|nr:hypothetical protein JG687_00011021 [Phytophthora cactorum]